MNDTHVESRFQSTPKAPDRRGSGGKGALFGDGEYVGFTAWPGMAMTITGDGWMGIAPAGQ